MRIKTNSDMVANDFKVVLLSDLTTEEQVLREKDGTVQTVDGDKTYKVRGAKVIQDGRELRDTYVQVKNRSELKALTHYVLDGDVEINAYGSVNTICADRLVEPGASKPAAKPFSN